jgi:hypothetical protein
MLRHPTFNIELLARKELPVSKRPVSKSGSDKDWVLIKLQDFCVVVGRFGKERRGDSDQTPRFIDSFWLAIEKF